MLLYVIAFVFGAFIGGQVNLAIYRFAFDARPISPWSAPHPDVGPRRAADRLPIIGWFLLRRDAAVLGRGFWIRPLLIEFCMGVGFAWLFQFVVNDLGLIPQRALAANAIPAWQASVWFGWYLFLISAMTAATFIDFDERTIPDEITVPGTLIGLILAATVPAYRLPVVLPVNIVESIHLGTPKALPVWVDERKGLWIALACFAIWCLALLPILWTKRRGLRKYFSLAWASLIRPARKTKGKIEIEPRRIHPWVWMVVAIGLCGTVGILAVWLFRDALRENWISLLSALVGMAFGGGIVWWIRIIGYLALQREAMGFGDVTLMAMIGAFVGWQSALLIFMFAPVVALLVVCLQMVFIRDSEIAYGPYLCISALTLMLGWQWIWNDWAAVAVFSMTEVLLQIMPAFLILAAPLLWIVSLIKTKLFGYID